MKTHRMQILADAFRAKYPGGTLCRTGRNAYYVAYRPEGKMYTYRCRDLYALAERLGLATQEVTDAMQGVRRLPCCGRVVDEGWDEYRCPACHHEFRRPTAAELETEAAWAV